MKTVIHYKTSTNMTWKSDLEKQVTKEFQAETLNIATAIEMFERHIHDKHPNTQITHISIMLETDDR